MPGKSDTIFRQWAMLRLIPREPQRVSTQAICQRLGNQGFEVTDRTVSRDLDRLSAIFGYTNVTSGKANLWFWPTNARVLDMPGLEPSAALAWVMSREQLRAHMPPANFRHLQPYFDRSEEVLRQMSGSSLPRWTNKFRVCHRGPRLLAPQVSDIVQDAVYAAVLEERRLLVSYQGRYAETPNERTLDPIAVVLRDGVLYLVALGPSYPRPVHFAIHRMKTASVMEEPARLPPRFDLDEYVEREFRYPESPNTFTLVVQFSRSAGIHLLERPLSPDQTSAETDDDELTITATVTDTAELRWWILGFGDQVEVIRPAHLRREISKIINAMATSYRKRVGRA